MNKPKLFRNRAGSWLIRESGEPMLMPARRVVAPQFSLTIDKKAFEQLETTVSWVFPAAEQKPIIATVS